jgi:hypothetical protein
MPRAPDKFSFALKLGTRAGDHKPLPIDWLAMDVGQQAKRGLPRVTFAQRLKVCRDIAAVAAIFEQQKIVYGDWSYANAFWSASDFTGYVIDVDTCAFGTRPFVNTPNWEDPLFQQGMPIDTTTDRYRLALLIARCLSGERDPAAAVRAAQAKCLAAHMPGIGQILTTTAHARSREARPAVAAILAQLTQSAAAPSNSGNVARWKQVGAKPTPHSTPGPRTTPPSSRPAQPSPSVPRIQPVPPQPKPPQPKPPQPANAADVALGLVVIGVAAFLLIGLIVFIAQAIF